MKTIRSSSLSVSALALSLAAGGSTACDVPPPSDATADQAVVGVESALGEARNPELLGIIRGATKPRLQPEVSPPAPTGSRGSCEAVFGDARNRCTYTEKYGLEHAEEMVAFQPNEDVLYPGAVIQTGQLAAGLLSPVPLPRTAVKLTLTGGDHEPSASVVPDKATVTTEIGKMRSVVKHVNAAIADYQGQSYSLEHGALQLKVDAKKLNATFGADWDNTKTNYLVKFTQRYYTVSATPPTGDADVLFDTVAGDQQALADARRFMYPGNAPGIISTVTYGRVLFVRFESSESAQKFKGTLDAEFKGITTNNSGDTKSILNASKMWVWAIGGDGKAVVHVVNAGVNKQAALEDLVGKYRLSGADFDPAYPGLPIGYTVRYIDGYQPAAVGFAAKFSQPDCGEVMNEASIDLTELYVYHKRWIGDAQMTYRIFVNGEKKYETTRTVERYTTYPLNQPIRVRIPERLGGKLGIRFEASVGNATAVSTTFDHEYNFSDGTWTNLGSQSLVANHANVNLKAHIKYTFGVKRIVPAGPLGGVVVAQPGSEGKDAQVGSWPMVDATNYANGGLLSAGTWTMYGGVRGSWRSYLAFDLAAISPTATIKKATLTLFGQKGGTTGVSPFLGHHGLHGMPNGFFVKRVTSPWSESTITWNAQPTLTDAGIELPKSTAVDQDYEVEVTDMVRQMVMTANHGFALLPGNPDPFTKVTFLSSDSDDIARRPRLEVEYDQTSCPR
jgi:thiol-activated cytolysin